MARAVDKGNMSLQSVCAGAPIAFAGWVDLLVTLERLVACRPRALWVVALVNLCIGITKLDGDVPLQLILEANGLDTRDSLDNGTLSVSDMSDGANVDGGLPAYNFGGEWGQLGEIDGRRIGLLAL